MENKNIMQEGLTNLSPYQKGYKVGQRDYTLGRRFGYSSEKASRQYLTHELRMKFFKGYTEGYEIEDFLDNTTKITECEN